MDINLIRLSSKALSANNKKLNDNYINELNDLLFDNDYVLKENVNNPIFSVLMIEDEDIDRAFKRLLPSLSNPTIILPGKSQSAFKKALEVNSYLNINDFHSFIAVGSDEEASSLIIEMVRILLAKQRLDYHNVAMIIDTESSLLDKSNTKSLKDTYNLNVIKIGEDELKDAILKAKSYPLLHKDYLMKNLHKNDFHQLVKLYNAINYLIDKYQLIGLCFKKKEYERISAPLSSIINEKGVSLIVDNDARDLMSLLIMNALHDSISFYADIVNIDMPKSNVTLSSSMIPFNVLDKEGQLKPGEVTLFKLCYDGKHFLAIQAKIVSGIKKDNHIEIIIHIDERELFELFRGPIGGSLAFSYGDSVGNLYAYDNLIRYEKHLK